MFNRMRPVRVRSLTITLAAVGLGLITADLVAADRPDRQLERLSWLSGCWGQDGAERGTGEMWTRVAGESLLGVGRTIREGRTVAYEFMRIEYDADGAITYTAQPAGQVATTFTLTHLDDREVVFENPAHDFPQRITYTVEGQNRMMAVIEGPTRIGEKRIEIPMTRAACR